MRRVSRSSEISRSTWHLTVRIHGVIQSSFSWMQTICRSQWQGVRRTDFQQTGSSGAIRSTTGTIIKRQDMHGGCGGSHIAFRCMISSGSIISEDSMNIMQFLTERKQQETENGSRVREWICLRRSESSLAICRSLRRISVF